MVLILLLEIVGFTWKVLYLNSLVIFARVHQIHYCSNAKTGTQHVGQHIAIETGWLDNSWVRCGVFVVSRSHANPAATTHFCTVTCSLCSQTEGETSLQNSAHPERYEQDWVMFSPCPIEKLMIHVWGRIPSWCGNCFWKVTASITQGAVHSVLEEP